MVSFKVNLIAFAFLLFAVESKLNHTKNNLIKVSFVKSTILNSFNDVLVVHTAITGHFKVKTCSDTFNSVVYCTPV